MAYKRYTVRLFPNKDQEEKLWKHVYACKWVWNYMLGINLEYHRQNNRYLMHFDMIYTLGEIWHDKDFYWLHDVSKHSLGLVCRDLATCINKYLHKYTNMPMFKKKRSFTKSFPVRNDKSGVRLISNFKVQVPKCGVLKCRFDYRKKNIKLIGEHLKDPRIKYTKNGKWILTFVLEYENQVLPTRNGTLGIDLGVKKIATCSYTNRNGEVVTFSLSNQYKLKRLIDNVQKAKHIRRNLSRKIKVAKENGYDWNDSKRFQKESEKYRKIILYEHNYIHDIYHRFTSNIVYNIAPQIIWMEDISVKTMVHGPFKSFNYELMRAHWGEFREMLIYKADSVGIPVLFASRTFPSTQICSNCGAKHKLKLNQRKYICSECGLNIDRDVNASINLMNYSDYRIEDVGIVYLDRHAKSKVYSRSPKKT